MVNNDNKTWLLAMELSDEEYGVMKNVKTTNDMIKNMKKLPRDFHFQIRQVKVLEIIAEELIKLNEKRGKL